MDLPKKRGSLAEELVLPLPAERQQIPAVTEFRSTWIVSSLATLRSSGYFDAYLEALRRWEDQLQVSASHELLSCVAGQWLSIAVSRVHYEACNSLGLDEDEVLRIAIAGDGGQVRRAWHAQYIGAAERPDATPWSILPQLHKVWLRGANGGAAAVYRVGENQARVEYVGCELFDVRHFRHATRAVLFLLGEHFCTELRVATLPQPGAGQSSFVMRWG